MADHELNARFEPLLAARGLELEQLSVKSAGRRQIVQVVVDGDGPKGRGPLLDDIAEAARELNRVVDEDDPRGVSPYTIEVSSRGVSRPLTRSAHWRRNRGRLVRVQVGEETVEGRVLGCEDEVVSLDVGGTEQSWPLAELGRALVQVEFNRSEQEEQ